MMFLRHGIFARRGRLERRRTIIVASAAVLLLAIVATIIGIVRAAGTADLGGSTGLTRGDISGVFSYNNDIAHNMPRDAQVTLDLTFNISGASAVDAAYIADYWSYDLSSLVNDSVFASIEDETGLEIEMNNEVIGTYNVSNNQVLVTVNKNSSVWLLNDVTGVITVRLNVDPEKVGTSYTYLNNTVEVEFPGSLTTPGQADSSPRTDRISFVQPAIVTDAAVYDTQDRYWKSGYLDNIAVEKNNFGQHVASYIANIEVNAYYQDLTIDLAVTNNQSLDGDLAIAYCNTYACAGDSTVAKTIIPSNFLQYENNDGDGNYETVIVQLASFLDSCKVSGNCEDGSGNKVIDGYHLTDSFDYVQPGSRYEILLNAVFDGNPTQETGIYCLDTYTSGTDYMQPIESTDYYYAHVEFTSVSDRIYDGAKRAVGRIVPETDGENQYIDYEVSLGANVNMSNMILKDRMTDNQVLVSAITVKDADDEIVEVIPMSDSRINSDFYDNNFDNDDSYFFVYTFPEGSNNGPYSFSYTVKLPKANLGAQVSVTNNVDLVIGNTEYKDIARSTDQYDFDVNQTYITNQVMSIVRENGVVEWLVRVYGPEDGGASSSFDNITISDKTLVDGYSCNAPADGPKLCTTYSEADVTRYYGTAQEETVDLGTAGITLTTSVDADGDPVITIDSIGRGEVINISFFTQANVDYILEHSGESLQITNAASTFIDGQNAEASAAATIMPPSPCVLTKTVEENNDGVYYRAENQSYQADTREGFKWTVTLNEGSVGALNLNYIPLFTDILPPGLYLADVDNSSATLPTYNSGIDTDVTQDNFAKKILVERTVFDGVNRTTEQKVLSVTTTTDANGYTTIEPIDIATPFNTDVTCNIWTQVYPTPTCAGVNHTEYKVYYQTTIKESDYRDYAHEHVYENAAVIVEFNGTDYYTHTFASATAVYKTKTAIHKHDISAHDGGMLNLENTMSYEVVINSEAASLNNGNPLSFSDTIEPNMAYKQQRYFVDQNDPRTADPSNAPVVCLDANDQLVASCRFTYDSDTFTIHGTLPDNTYLVVKYNVNVANPIPGSIQTFENTAKLENDFDVVFEDTVSETHAINSNQTFVYGTDELNLVKVDNQDTMRTIQGVGFTLYRQEYDAGTGVLGQVVQSQDLQSDGYGRATTDGIIYTDVDEGQYADLYYWEEKTAPSPYMPASTTRKHYFMMYASGHDSDEAEENRDITMLIASVLEGTNPELNEGDIWVIPGGLPWIVSNAAQDVTTLDVEKTVSGNTADPTKEFEITISATNSRGEDMIGTVNAYSYDLDNPTTMTAISGGVTFVDGETTVNLAHNQGIRIEGVYVGGSYSVEETEYQSYTTVYSCIADSGCASNQYSGTAVSTGQTIAISNTSTTSITGKKQSFGIFFALAGGCIAALGAVIVIKVRH